MLRSLVVMIALGSVAHAEPELAAVRLAAHVVSAMHDGDCDAVRALVARMQALDRDYYLRTFATDPVIGACESPPAASADGAESSGILVGAAIGVGSGVQLDARFGVMIGGHVAVFGAATVGGTIADDGNTTYAIGALGARVYLAGWFVDLRGGWGHGHHDECDFSITQACTKRGAALFAGGGRELVRTRSFGLELHGELAYVGGVGGMVGGLGVSFY